MEYAYMGYTAAMQIVKGKVFADNEMAASAMLSRQGYNVIDLKQVKPFMPNVVLFRKKVSTNELVTFSRQLALLLSSGIGIIRCLELLSDQTSDAELRRVVKSIVPELRSGSTLAEAMSKHPNVFSKMYSKLVEVGERTGSLDAVLKNLANYAEKESKASAKIKSALTYPAIVGVLGIIVGIVLVTFVLPPIIGMFKSLGGDLPLITKILINSVDFVKNNIIPIAVTIIIVVLVALTYFRTSVGSYTWNALKLKIPLIGRVSHITELARLCRSMSLLFRAGLPVSDIISLSAQGIGNKTISKGLKEVGQDALKGLGLARPMRERKVFLPLMTELIGVGEETGNLEESLIMVAENYEAEADVKTQRLLSMIEPVMTIAMGLFVGFLALSVFVPLYGSLQYIK
jgi:type IV pilus assembly protein PilC